MEKLELKHLAPYLPYGLEAYGASEIIKIKGATDKVIYTRFPLQFFEIFYREFQDDFSLLLRPLSDLTKEIEHNGERCVPIDMLNRHNPWLMVEGESFVNFQSGQPKRNEDLPYWLVQQIFEWHFDVFGLIEKGLAIDKNTLNQ